MSIYESATSSGDDRFSTELIYAAHQVDQEFVGTLIRLYDNQSGWVFEGRLKELTHTLAPTGTLTYMAIASDEDDPKPVWSGYVNPNQEVGVPASDAG